MEQLEISTTDPMVNNYEEFDFDNIQYNYPVERNNCKYIDILNKNQDILIFKTPQLIVKKVIKKSDSNKYIDLIINDKIKSFFEFIANIDDNNMLNIYNNSNRWFKKNIPLDVLDDFHNPAMRMNKNGNAIFRTRYTNDKLDNLTKGDIAIFTIKLDSIKLYRREFRTQWLLTDYDTDNVNYEFGDDILDCESVYDVDEDEYSSESDNEYNSDSEYNSEININNETESNINNETESNINNDTNEEENIGELKKLEIENNKKKVKPSNSDCKSIKSTSTSKSYKKKRIIYANKEKIWNN